MNDEEASLKSMKGVTWEVTLRSAPELYYKGRGDTPTEAMEDLLTCLRTGAQDAQQKLDGITRRRDLIEEALVELHLAEEEVSEP